MNSGCGFKKFSNKVKRFDLKKIYFVPNLKSVELQPFDSTRFEQNRFEFEQSSRHM